MKYTQFENFDGFCDTLLQSGFSMGGGNPKGIYSVVPFTWEEQDGIDSPVKWHTGDPETDPWEWRMRVLEERDDIAYSKLFFRTSGFVTAEWYPRFLAVRRQGQSFEEAYSSGTVSHTAKRIYDAVAAEGEIAFHDIKSVCGFKRLDNSAFESALTELQMRMFVTICGRTQRTSINGKGYGWSVTVFSTAEDFWAVRGVKLRIPDEDESFDAIRERILKLNPNAKEKDIRRFIRG